MPPISRDRPTRDPRGPAVSDLFAEAARLPRGASLPTDQALHFLIYGEGSPECIPGKRDEIAAGVKSAWLAGFHGRLPDVGRDLPLFAAAPEESLARRTKALVQSDPQRMLPAVVQGLHEALAQSPRIAAGTILADLGLFVLEEATQIAYAARRSWEHGVPSLGAPRVMNAALTFARELESREPADPEGAGHRAWRTLQVAVENIQSAGNANIIVQCLKGAFIRGEATR